jgi:hypothetical protein
VATSIDICNQALSHIGAAAKITAIDPPDGSAEANHAARFYLSAVYRALARIDWSFARTRAALGAVALPDTAAWAYAYAKPSDCVTVRRITTGSASQFEDDSADFELEGETLLTNQADAVLIYTRAVTDAAKFPVLFTDVVALDLAAFLAGPILRGGEGINAAGKLRELARRAALEAAAVDASNSARPATQYVPGSLAARGATPPLTASTMLAR